MPGQRHETLASLPAAVDRTLAAGVNAVLLITFVGTIRFGLYPNPVINFILRPNLLGH